MYVGSEPSSPDNCITVYDTAPKDDGRSMIDGETFHHYGLQVRVRAKDYRTGYRKAEEIHVTLDEEVRANVVHIDSVKYIVDAIGGTTLMTLGRDSATTKRSLFTVNALMALTQGA